MARNTVTVSEKGAVVIPKEIRERYGICPGDRIHILAIGGEIMLMKIPPGDPIERGLGLLKGGSMQRILEDKRRELEAEERDLPPPRARA